MKPAPHELSEAAALPDFNPLLHPRDALGRFARKLGGLPATGPARGRRIEMTDGTRVVRDTDGSYRVVRSGRIVRGFRTPTAAARNALDRSAASTGAESIGGRRRFRSYDDFLEETVGTRGDPVQTRTGTRAEFNATLAEIHRIKAEGDEYERRQLPTLRAKADRLRERTRDESFQPDEADVPPIPARDPAGVLPPDWSYELLPGDVVGVSTPSGRLVGVLWQDGTGTWRASSEGESLGSGSSRDEAAALVVANAQSAVGASAAERITPEAGEEEAGEDIGGGWTARAADWRPGRQLEILTPQGRFAGVIEEERGTRTGEDLWIAYGYEGEEIWRGRRSGAINAVKTRAYSSGLDGPPQPGERTQAKLAAALRAGSPGGRGLDPAVRARLEEVLPGIRDELRKNVWEDDDLPDIAKRPAAALALYIFAKKDGAFDDLRIVRSGDSYGVVGRLNGRRIVLRPLSPDAMAIGYSRDDLARDDLPAYTDPPDLVAGTSGITAFLSEVMYGEPDVNKLTRGQESFVSEAYYQGLGAGEAMASVLALPTGQVPTNDATARARIVGDPDQLREWLVRRLVEDDLLPPVSESSYRAGNAAAVVAIYAFAKEAGLEPVIVKRATAELVRVKFGEEELDFMPVLDRTPDDRFVLGAISRMPSRALGSDVTYGEHGEFSVEQFAETSAGGAPVLYGVAAGRTLAEEMFPGGRATPEEAAAAAQARAARSAMLGDIDRLSAWLTPRLGALMRRPPRITGPDELLPSTRALLALHQFARKAQLGNVRIVERARGLPVVRAEVGDEEYDLQPELRRGTITNVAVSLSRDEVGDTHWDAPELYVRQMMANSGVAEHRQEDALAAGMSEAERIGGVIYDELEQEAAAPVPFAPSPDAAAGEMAEALKREMQSMRDRIGSQMSVDSGVANRIATLAVAGWARQEASAGRLSDVAIKRTDRGVPAEWVEFSYQFPGADSPTKFYARVDGETVGVGTSGGVLERRSSVTLTPEDLGNDLNLPDSVVRARFRAATDRYSLMLAEQVDLDALAGRERELPPEHEAHLRQAVLQRGEAVTAVALANGYAYVRVGPDRVYSIRADALGQEELPKRAVRVHISGSSQHTAPAFENRLRIERGEYDERSAPEVAVSVYVGGEADRHPPPPGRVGSSSEPASAAARALANPAAWELPDTGSLAHLPMAVRTVVQRLHGFQAGTDAHGGAYTAVISDSDEWGWSGWVADSQGARVGSFRRRVEDGGSGVYHSSFNMSADERGGGFGTEFIEESFEAYRAAGYERVRVQAVDTGGYMWAKMGFENQGGGVPHVNTYQIERDIAAGHVPQALYDELRRQIDEGLISSPQQLAAFGRRTTWENGRHTMWLGKAALHGMSWYGVKEL